MQATTNVNVKNSMMKSKRKHSRGSKANIDSVKLPDELVDLIKEDENNNNYIGGVIALIVIAFLLGLIAIATYFTLPRNPNGNNLEPFYFHDIFKMASLEKNFEFLWRQDNLVFRNASGNFYSVLTSRNNYSSGVLLLPKKYYQRGMIVSMDTSTWLIPQHHRKTLNLNDECEYEIMHILNNQPYYRQLSINGMDDNYFSSVTWGPKDKDMVAIYQGNIYYSKNPLIEKSFICLSCNLAQDRLYGQFIGNYADHIFKSNRAYWWSADGKSLAFLSMAEEEDKLVEVETFKFQNLYPEFVNISYSKAGLSPAPYQFQIYTVDKSTQKRFHIDLHKFVPFKSFFLAHIQWYNSSSLLACILSREQTSAIILFCTFEIENCFLVLEQRFTTGWIDMREYQNMLILEDQNAIAIGITTSDAYAARRHLAILKLDRQSKNIIKWLTIGNNFILLLHYYDQIYKNIFYVAINSNSTNQHLYRTNINSRITECVTCSITSCYRNQLHFTGRNVIFLLECLGPNPRHYQLFHMEPNQNQILWSANIETNSAITRYLSNKSLSRVEYYPIQMVNRFRKYQVLSKIHHPRFLNPDHVIKYPVLLVLSDDPFSMNIRDDFDVGWIEYLTSYLRFVVIQMEVRGTGNRYFNYHTSLTNNMGSEDMKDIIAGLKLLIMKRSYMDNSSIGVIGQKYGGYMTVKLLYDHGDFPIFRCGTSINPIVDFSIYDSSFSEKYFQVYKKTNLYYKNSQFKFTSNLSMKEFLLIHDMTQNDVLFDNSAKLMKNLVSHGIQFDYLPLYENHFPVINWNKNQYVLKKIAKFFTNCFNKSSSRYSLLSNNEIHSF